jgi:hypothetical protein
LAKVKYELECQKWSQGIINKLRIKGLTFLSEVSPLSKFVVCLKNVDTPKALLDKCVDLYLELKALTQFSHGGKLEMNTNLHLGLPMEKTTTNNNSNTTSSKLKKEKTISSSAMINSQKEEKEEGERKKENNDDDIEEIPALKTKKISFRDDFHQHEEEEKYKEERKEGEEEYEEYEEDEDDELGRSSSFQSHSQSQSHSSSALSHSTSSAGFSSSELSLLEQANQLLQEILENSDSAEWCSLTANIEELFIQAAFLVVPHKSNRFPHWNDLIEKNDEKDKDTSDFQLFKPREEKEKNNEGEVEEENEESLMGNFAYKLYMMELFTLENGDEKVDFVKARFRAAVIFTSPFTLYLKSRGITTVKQLLTIDLKDLSLPNPLFIQLEILLNIIISKKIVQANLLAVPRDVHNLSKDSYYTPMFYDQKFQRTPLDMFGKPIGIGITQIKNKLKAKDQRNQVKKRISQNDFNPVVEEDMHKAVSLWEKNENKKSTTKKNTTTAIMEDRNDDEQEDMGRRKNNYSSTSSLTSNQRSVSSPKDHKTTSTAVKSKDGKKIDFADEKNHQFDFIASQMDDQSYREQIKALLPPSSSSALFQNSNTNNSNSILATAPGHHSQQQSALPSQQSHDHPVSTSHSSYRPGSSNNNTNSNKNQNNNNNNSRSSKTRPSAHSSSVSSPLPFLQEREIGISSHPFQDPRLTREIFHNTYLCEHPNCGQVFSRLYTYKVHLRTHENFPEYYEYKRNPQLFYDKVNN